MFIKGIPSEKLESIDLLAAIINLGRDLGYSLIVEGIESRAQAIISSHSVATAGRVTSTGGRCRSRSSLNTR